MPKHTIISLSHMNSGLAPELSIMHIFRRINNINRRVESRNSLESLIQARRERSNATTLCAPGCMIETPSTHQQHTRFSRLYTMTVVLTDTCPVGLTWRYPIYSACVKCIYKRNLLNGFLSENICVKIRMI